MSEELNDKIFDAMCMAETFPESGCINWGEVPLDAVWAFASQNEMTEYDIESVQETMIKAWNTRQAEQARKEPKQ